MKHAAVLASMLCLLALLTAGCGETKGPVVEISYDLPARTPLPEKVKKIAVAEFTGKAAEDQRWGVVAADSLGAALEQANRGAGRLQLVDRRNLSKILHEQDIKILNSDQAVQAGKIAEVQAIIYGSVTVFTKDEQASRTVLRPSLSLSAGNPITTETKHYTKRYTMAAVNFTMDDIDTGKTIRTVSIKKEFDSDKDGNSSGLSKMFGFNSDSPPPADKTVSQIIDLCVKEFVSEISPHHEAYAIALDGGAGLVETGNELARTKDYAAALEYYVKALGEKDNATAAAFNAGAMCEATGDLEGALKYYTRAFESNSKDPKYLDARRRVKDALRTKAATDQK